jgi:hypothetical protein
MALLNYFSSLESDRKAKCGKCKMPFVYYTITLFECLGGLPYT